MSRTRESVRGGCKGFFVDVGERDLFYVEIEDTVEYEQLHASMSSLIMCATSSCGDRTVVRVSWSKYKRVAQGKGYIGMERCADLQYVPDLYSRDLHVVGSTYVEVSTRQYIPGYPLCDVWCDLSEEEKETIMVQIENVIHDISEYTSPTFMELQGRNLSTSSPVQYINYRILLSMITRDLKKGDMKILDMQDFPHKAVLCHNSLSMDHIIVNSGGITGIVGWSKCDYVPEVTDRMRYQFTRPRLEGESSWYSKLAMMELFHPQPPPLYTVCCMYYNYYLRLRSTPPDHHDFLERKLLETSDTVIPVMRETYMGIDISRAPGGSDHGSRAEHVSGDIPIKISGITGTRKDSKPPSISTWENWETIASDWEGPEDTETVLDILDKLSVA